MGVTVLAKTGLRKQTFRDKNWDTALDAGFDAFEARIGMAGTGTATGAQDIDPNWPGQTYVDADANLFMATATNTGTGTAAGLWHQVFLLDKTNTVTGTLNIEGAVGFTGNSSAKASASDIRHSNANVIVTPDGLESAAALVEVTEATLVSGVDWDDLINAYVNLTANRVVGAISNGQPGTWRSIKFVQDATGNRTLDWTNGEFYTAGGEAPTLTTDANAEDWVHIFCETTSKFIIYSSLDIGVIS